MLAFWPLVQCGIGVTALSTASLFYMVLHGFCIQARKEGNGVIGFKPDVMFDSYNRADTALQLWLCG